MGLPISPRPIKPMRSVMRCSFQYVSTDTISITANDEKKYCQVENFRKYHERCSKDCFLPQNRVCLQKRKACVSLSINNQLAKAGVSVCLAHFCWVTMY